VDKLADAVDAVEDRKQAYQRNKSSGLVADWVAFKQEQTATAQLVKAARKLYSEQCHHHHHVTQSSHSINAIGPAPLCTASSVSMQSHLLTQTA
jgi:hypothetical protein